MDKKALDYAFGLFVKDGYNGDINAFTSLINENPDALNHAHKLFVSDGYNGDINTFKSLIGIGQQQPEAPKKKDGGFLSQPLEAVQEAEQVVQQELASPSDQSSSVSPSTDWAQVAMQGATKPIAPQPKGPVPAKQPEPQRGPVFKDQAIQEGPTTEQKQQLSQYQATDEFGIPLTELQGMKPVAREEFLAKPTEEIKKEVEVKERLKKIEEETPEFLKPSVQGIKASAGKTTDTFVQDMNYQFGDAGFEFTQKGVGFNIEVKTPDGEIKNIEYNPDYPDQAVTEIQYLIRTKSTGLRNIDKIEKMYKDENKKFSTEYQVDFAIKEQNKEQEELALQTSDFLKRKTEAESSLKSINEMPLNQRPANYRDLKFQAEQNLTRINDEADEIQKRIDLIPIKIKNLETAIGKYNLSQSTQGSWVGQLKNTILTGLGGMVSGFTDIGIDIKSNIIPLPTLLGEKNYEQKVRLYSEQLGLDADKVLLSPEYFDKLSDPEKRSAVLKAKEYRQMVEPLIRDEYQKSQKYGTEDEITFMEGARVALRQGFGSKSSTQQWEDLTRKNWLANVVLGGIETLPSMIGPSAWIRRAQAYAVADDMLNKEYENNPELKDISENEKLFVKIPIGLANAWLEEKGFSNIVKNTALVKSITGRALIKATKGVTPAAFKKIISNEVSEMITDGVLRVVGGGLIEFETGALQKLNEITTKSIYNLVKEKELFDTPDTVLDVAADTFMGGLEEMIGSISISTPTIIGAAFKDKKINDIPQEYFDVFVSSANDINTEKGFIQDLKSKIISGEMTKQDAVDLLNNYRNSVGLLRSVPPELNNEDKKKAMSLLRERKELEQRKEGKDDALAKPIQAKIDAINEQLTKLSEDAIQKQAAGEVPVQSEAGVGETMVQGEPQAGPQVTPKQTIISPEEIKSKREEIERNRQADLESQKDNLDEVWTVNSKRTVRERINEKYDAELAALEQQAAPKVQPTQLTIEERKAKEDDIEKRRQEEFDQYANDIIVKTELYEDGEGRKYLVHTLKNGKKRLDTANEDGKRTSTLDVYESSVPVENYITNAKKISDIEKQSSKQENRINAKYDAELAELQPTVAPATDVTPTTEAKVEFTEQDRTRKAELEEAMRTTDKRRKNITVGDTSVPKADVKAELDALNQKEQASQQPAPATEATPVERTPEQEADLLEELVSGKKKQPTTKEKGKEKSKEKKEATANEKTAKRLRDKKIRGAMSAIDFGITQTLYNGALEFMARQVEKGTKIGNAIANTMKWIDDRMDGKKWNKGAFGKYMNDTYKVTLGDGREVEVLRDDSKETAEVINGWYQPIEQKILDTKEDKLPANKWAERLRSKEDEDLWTGVREYLEGRGNESVSKKDLLDFMRDNRVEIVEVVKGAKQKLSQKEMDDVYNNINEQLSRTNQPQEIKDFVEEKLNNWYNDPNDSNYKTLYNVLGEANMNLDDFIEDALGKMDNTQYSQYQLPGDKSDYKEVLITFPNKIRSEFNSSHFDEPNILVHLRMNTRTDADGNKVLFLEEIQSDWGQEGKKKGFKTSDKFDESKIKTKRAFGNLEIYYDNILVDTLYTKYYENEQEIKDDVLNRAKSYYNYSLSNKTIPSAPFVTDTNSWVKLGLKVTLREAVAQGADKIAWTTGEQQNARYDLSKQIEKISYDKSDNTITAWNKDGKQVIQQTAKESELPNIIGKDVSDKLLNQKEDEEGVVELSGQDIKVGGKGMKGFYGSSQEGTKGIVGGVAEKLFGQKAGKVKIEGNTQQSIDVTPELKAEVEKGLPMFENLKLSDMVRNLQIKTKGLQSNILGVPIAIWNAGVETVAKAIDAGIAIKDAISKGLKNIKDNYSGKFNEKLAEKKMLISMYSEPIKMAREAGIGNEGIKVYLERKGLLEDQIDTLLKYKERAEKKAPSAEKIVGKPKPKKVTVNEMTALKDQIRLEAKAAKEAKGDLNAKRKQLAAAINAMVSSGVLTARQAEIIIRRVNLINLDNPDMVERLLDYADKVFKDADYANKLKTANKFKSNIKTLSKNENKNGDLRFLGTQFIQIDPSMVEDINSYIDMASKIQESIKGSTLTATGLKQADIVNISEAYDYINEALKNQEKVIKEITANRIETLLSVDVSDLTYNQMLELIDLIKREEFVTEEDKETLSKKIDDLFNLNKEKEKSIRDTIKNMFSTYSSIIDSMFRTGKDPFVVYDESLPYEKLQFKKSDIKLVREFMNMDLNKLSAKEALLAVDALNNFITNRSTANMATVVGKYRAKVNSEKLVKENIKSKALRLFFSKGLGRLATEQLVSLPMVFERLFKSSDIGLRVMEDMGLTNVMNGASKAITDTSNIVNEYMKVFSNKKPNKKAFNDVYNIIERGMVAHMSRSKLGDAKQIQEEFNDRKREIEESIKVLSKGTDNEQKKAEVYKEVYNKILKDSKNSDEVKSKADKINIQAVNWMTKEWNKHYSDLADVSLSVYNTMLDKDKNYTPDRYQLLESGKQKPIDENASSFNYANGNISEKKSGTLMKTRDKKSGLPKDENGKVNRYVDLSFDSVNASALYSAFTDINTAQGIKQVKAFIASDAFEEIIPNANDRNILEERIKLAIRNIKQQNQFYNSELDKLARALDEITRFSASMALAGPTQVPKQTFSVGLNTLVNTGQLPSLDILYDKDKMDFINKSGRAIANRGPGSQIYLDSVNRMMEEAARSKPEEALKLLKKANDLWLKWTLANPDAFIAKASWLAYYEKSLKDQGLYRENIKPIVPSNLMTGATVFDGSSGIDYSTHELNEKAANYAQMMVDRNQNITDSRLAGSIYAGDMNAYNKFFIRTLLPLASFRLNQWQRNASDFIILTSETSSLQDKGKAFRSLSAFGVEQAMYRGIAVGFGVIFWKLADLILTGGEEEDEEEWKKRINNMIKGQATGLVTDVISPFPIADPYVKPLFNYGLSLGQDLMKIEEKDKLSIYTEDMNEDSFAKSLGMYGIALDKALSIYEDINMSITGEFKDNFNNTKYVNEEGRNILKNSITPSILFNLGLIPGAPEFNNIMGKVKRQIKKSGETKKQIEKNTAYSGYDTLEEFEKLDPEKYNEYSKEGGPLYEYKQKNKESEETEEEKAQKYIKKYGPEKAAILLEKSKSSGGIGGGIGGGIKEGIK